MYNFRVSLNGITSIPTFVLHQPMVLKFSHAERQMTDKASSMCVNFMGILQRTHKVKSFHFINDDFNSVFQYYFHDNKILARTFLNFFF